MFFIDNSYISEFEEKKSKFIAHLIPYSDFDETMQTLRKNHPKARHFVYAYRYLNQYDQIVENSSDDGEPKGTSGKPTLTVLSGNSLINTAVIVVRYFGGIKLGTGGLVRAYSDSTNKAILEANLLKYEKLFTQTFTCEYNELSKIEYELKNLNIEIIDKQFTSNVQLTLKSSKDNLDTFFKNY